MQNQSQQPFAQPSLQPVGPQRSVLRETFSEGQRDFGQGGTRSEPGQVQQNFNQGLPYTQNIPNMGSGERSFGGSGSSFLTEDAQYRMSLQNIAQPRETFVFEGQTFAPPAQLPPVAGNTNPFPFGRSDQSYLYPPTKYESPNVVGRSSGVGVPIESITNIQNYADRPRQTLTPGLPALGQQPLQQSMQQQSFQQVAPQSFMQEQAFQQRSLQPAFQAPQQTFRPPQQSFQQPAPATYQQPMQQTMLQPPQTMQNFQPQVQMPASQPVQYIQPLQQTFSTMTGPNGDRVNTVPPQTFSQLQRTASLNLPTAAPGAAEALLARTRQQSVVPSIAQPPMQSVAQPSQIPPQAQIPNLSVLPPQAVPAAIVLNQVIDEPFAGIRINTVQAAPQGPQMDQLVGIQEIAPYAPGMAPVNTNQRIGTLQLLADSASGINFSGVAPNGMAWSQPGQLGNIAITPKMLQEKNNSSISTRLISTSSSNPAGSGPEDLKYHVPDELRMLPAACTCKQRIYETHLRKLINEEKAAAVREGRVGDLANVFEKLGTSKICCRKVIVGSPAIVALRKKIGFDQEEDPNTLISNLNVGNTGAYGGSGFGNAGEEEFPPETGLPPTAVIDTEFNQFANIRDQQSISQMPDIYDTDGDVYHEDVEESEAYADYINDAVPSG